MELINNTTKTLRDDLAVEIKQGSRLSVAAACFSIYAFQELKKELQGIDELRFIFTSPTFTTEKAKKEKREFYIPRLNRERSLYGTEFEVKLRNELNQKAIAKECAEWIRNKVTFKSNVTNENMMGFINLDDKNYMPINGFTTVDLGCERGNNAYNMVQKTEVPFSTAYIDLFDNLWNDTSKLQEVTDEVIENITAAYNENSPDFIYFVTLYNIFSEFLEDISEDHLPNEATGFKESKIWSMLYNFQKDAVLAIISKLEKYNGCILADSVGLGKTFTALAVIKYYENRNKSVLVLCPKKLTNNWNTYKDNYVNNPIASDRLRYDVLYHTDLNRTHGKSNGLDLDRLNWCNYDLVVIDESHNFRNGGKLSGEDNEKENRYLKLLNKVIRKGVKTKVLMLSATPVNNRFNDLKNQLALAYEGNTDLIDDKLNTTKSIDEIFKNAQRAFNTWSKWDPVDRTTENLLRMLDFDFFEVLDSVTIARSRKHIQKYYDTSDIGTFPTRLKPISLRPPLTSLKKAINYNEIFEQLTQLSLSIYTPTHFILPSKMEKYAELYEDNKVNVGFTQANREQGIRRLTAINLMKRMESSVHSFNLTLKRIYSLIDSTIHSIDTYVDERGPFRASDLTAPGSKAKYNVIHPITKKPCKTGSRGWAYSESEMQKLIDNDYILFGSTETVMPQLKNYLFDNEKSLPKSVLFFDSQSSTKWMKAQGFGFDFPKAIDYIKFVVSMYPQTEYEILDFFSGSATTAHAIMQLNAEDGGHRKFIMVQLPEKCDEKSEAYKAGYKNICEIGKERIRRAGKKIKDENPLNTQNLDIGFRVLKCDTSNMKDVYYSPADFELNLLDMMEDNIKEDRTPEDLLFQVMLDLGVTLSSKIEETTIAGKKVFDVADGFLIACFDKDVNDETIKAIAQKQPYYFVMRDSSLANDSVATNFEQIFATYSPDTVRKVL